MKKVPQYLGITHDALYDPGFYKREYSYIRYTDPLYIPRELSSTAPNRHTTANNTTVTPQRLTPKWRRYY